LAQKGPQQGSAGIINGLITLKSTRCKPKNSQTKEPQASCFLSLGFGVLDKGTQSFLCRMLRKIKR
jgi:hypothetical protein